MEHIISPKSPTVFGRPRKAMAGGVPKGRWIVWNQRVGIAHDELDGMIEVHLTDEDGGTVLVTHQPPESLREARLSEIPEARRPSAELNASLGYRE